MQHHRRFLTQMREATQLLQTSGPAAATAAIQRALQGAPGPRTGKTNAGWSPSMLDPRVLLDEHPVPADSAHTDPDPAADILSRLHESFWRKGKGTSTRQPGQDVEV